MMTSLHLEENNLLLTILKKRYSNSPEKLEKINALVSDYSEGDRTKSGYEKILNLLHGLIANDVPQNILLYFLTTIPVPKENINNNANSDSDLLNLMQKSRKTISESINVSLREYLKDLTKTEINSDDNIDFPSDKETNKKQKREDSDQDYIFIKPKKKAKLCKKTNPTLCDYTIQKCKSLLDLCAQNVISNFTELNDYYKRKNELIWNVLHKNPGQEDTKLCFAVLNDLNKKRKWLRMIDSNKIPLETLKDDFKDSYVLFKKFQKPQIESKVNAFEVSDELKSAIIKYIND